MSRGGLVYLFQVGAVPQVSLGYVGLHVGCAGAGWLSTE